MSYNRRSGGYGGGNSGNYGNSYGQSGGNNFSGPGNYGSGGGGGNYNAGGGGGGRFNNYNNYGRNPKMSPWESGVSPGGGMMPNVHPNQMALASDLLSKLLAPNQGGYGGGQNWGPNPGMIRRQESFKNQNRRRPDNRNRRPPPKKDDKKKDSKPEADKNDKSKETNGVKKDTAEQEHVDYDGIPTAVLFCHVCQKHMWDGASFEKHVRGRPHELMMTYLDEGYKMQVELMRHQIKAAENQREIDLERMQAQNKGKAKPLFRNYCPMCNINFYGPLTGHRKSDRHRKLKQFLHPECKMCDTLFHTRLEWDDHKLSADHLRKVGEQRRQFNPDLKDDEFELLDVIVIEDSEPAEVIPVASKPDMLNDKEIKEEEDDDDKDEQAITKETGDNEDTKMETDNEVDKEEKQTNDKEENDVKDETTAGKEDITTNVSTTEETTVVKKEKEEKYNPANVVGRELVVKTEGHVCRICAMFMKNDEEAELHCQTASHYINLTSITKLHAKINNRKRKMKEDKKENGNDDVNTENTEGEQPEKRVCLNEPENNKPVAEQNGTEESETVNEADNDNEDEDVQEIKVDIPVIDVADDEVAVQAEETEVADPEPAKETQSPTSATKTTPTRGRGGGRGRGVARRGRSSR
ncbi:zinc finger protein on ecdysone puffs-like [Sipha flava]|uniref:Zinc finger protein on ecdysone puffs-like n=2 Tax=Sipha flava TaxID=143950 RepID=A0A8B8GST6_9HEMI|nr:zinc finger protein on ecdysone puffs-like [Sipha flava]XP_025425333.1 zinc finger protein on ecdysone puffs-like [Sipha flava]XP_025425334.1 zinc finger protein on ecdysone puffs-like [Sipha flava]